jgi:hypothetical protein
MTIALTFTCTWIIPNMLTNFVIVFMPTANPLYLLRATNCVGIMSIINGCNNFIVYVWRHGDFRRYILQSVGQGNAGTIFVTNALSVGDKK